MHPTQRRRLCIIEERMQRARHRLELAALAWEYTRAWLRGMG